MKAVRHGPEDIEADDANASSNTAETAPPKTADPEPTQQSSKSTKFLREDPAEAASSSDDEPRKEGGETRGQVLQRHKREQKALKEQAKRLGKKAKDEVAKLESEMAARHAAELAAFDAPKADVAATVALAGSLYSVSLAGEEEEQEPKQQKKPTKSQRKKAERAQKEAEREARIAAELAEMGDTERVLEERELREQLRPLGLTIREIPPDGHCLYRSLEDQLRPSTSGQGEDGDGDGGAVNFLQLRQQAADYMRKHADHFMPFVLEEGAGDPADAFEAYCRQVEMTAAWGGHPELHALAHALSRHILVHCAGMPVLEVGEEFKGTAPTLRLCYLRHAYGLGEHYNSVQQAVSVAEGESEEDEEQEGRDGDAQ